MGYFTIGLNPDVPVHDALQKIEGVLKKYDAEAPLNMNFLTMITRDCLMLKSVSANLPPYFLSSPFLSVASDFWPGRICSQ